MPSKGEVTQRAKALSEHKLIRSATKKSLTRIRHFVDENGETMLLSEVECRLGLLESYFKQFVATELQIEKLEDGQDPYREEIEEIYIAAKSVLTDRMHELTPVQDGNNTSVSVSSFSAAGTLPGIPKIPKFGGNYAEFPNFIASFEKKINKNPHFDDLDKFNILMDHLFGSAKESIGKYEVNSTNYQSALTKLKDRFDNKNLIYSEHVSALFDLPKVSKDSGSQLRSLVDIVNAHVGALLANGTQADIANALIIHLVVQKLDSESRERWEETIDYSKLSSWENCRAILERRCNHLEARESKSSVNREAKFPVNSNHSQSKSKFHRRQNTALVTAHQIPCDYCSKSDHSIQSCENYRRLTVMDRFGVAKRLSLCLNCLAKGHSVRACKLSKCAICSGPHNQLLHRFANNNSSSSNIEISTNLPPVGASNGDAVLFPTSAVGSRDSREDTLTLLATAVVYIADRVGSLQPIRVLLDSGSHINFITTEAVQRLGLRKKKVNQQINGIGGISTQVRFRTDAVMRSRCHQFSLAIDLFVLSSITGPQPSSLVDISRWAVPPNLELADPNFFVPSKIDLLLGANYFFSLLSVGQVKLGEGLPILQKTLLGWIVSGGGISSHLLTCNLAQQEPVILDHSSLDFLLRRFWEIETVEDKLVKWTEEQSACETHFVDHTVRRDDGRFCVSLPFKSNPNLLGHSFSSAQKRFFSLERRLAKNDELRQQYSAFLQEYQRLDHMELVPQNEIHKVKYYTPHQCVIRPDSSSTKLRVVFDASAKTSSNLSLNDVLMNGPPVQEDLYSIVLRFRYGKYALTADVSKMYRQILVNADDSYYQCILWRSSPEEELRTYRLKTVTYGTTSAPFLATRCLVSLAEIYSSNLQLGSGIVKSNFYMDDLICSADSEQEVLSIHQEVSEILSSAGFQLRKWFTNSAELLQLIPKIDREIPLRINDSDVIKTLGIVWDPLSDSFHYICPEFQPSSKVTKRIVLSQMSSLFDPLGLINPIVVRAKVFMQELWKLQLKWDESLPLELHHQWVEYIQQLQNIQTISIPRYIFCPASGRTVEIHGFSDASMKAYGCCIYIRSVEPSGEVVVNLLTAKSRVAPIQTQSLARLELCGALLLVDLLQKIKPTFHMSINSIYLWVDSMVVLDWLSEHPSSWQTFVSNRVAKIQEKTHIDQWRHVPTAYNPADIISKGSTIDSLTSSIWFTGPPFLKEPASCWPPTRLKRSRDDVTSERRKSNISLLVAAEPDPLHHLFARTFDLDKLCRIVAYMLWFVDKFRGNSSSCLGPKSIPISPQYLEKALVRLVWSVQQRAFAGELRDLQSTSSSFVQKSSRISSLNPFVEFSTGVPLLRVGGRLKNSQLPYESKFPLLLPRDHLLTKMYFRSLHLRNHHAGPQALVAFSRQKFWILNAREVAKSTVRRCIVCFKHRPVMLNQIMGHLPAHRVEAARPFDRVGVDFCGPVQLTHRLRGKRPYKAYISVFVCFSTKAIHIELVSDLSSDAFVAALKRFIGRRGLCQHLYSDNGTNFVGCRNTLKEYREKFLEQQIQGKIASWCSSAGIEFHNIPPNAPHFGGLWESSVKSAKFHLYRTLKNELLTFEEMTTILVEIEAVLNSRPLCKSSQDPSDEAVLTPGHFLVGGPLNAMPEPIQNSLAVPLHRRWRYINSLKNHFWQRWAQEYLVELQQRYKWKQQKANIEIGNIVLVADDNIPPQHWLLGRIERATTSSDGNIRVVDVRTSKGTYRRPIQKIAVLPLDVESVGDDSKAAEC